MYVRPFPGPGGKWQISDGGGDYATWSRVRPNCSTAPPTADHGRLVSRGRRFVPRRQAAALVRGRFVAQTARTERSFDLHPDGERFALAAVPETQRRKQDKVVFIFNFFDELRRLAPAKR